MEFPKLCAKAHTLPRDPDAVLADDELTALICSDCPFYKEGVDEELECGAYHLLVHLLKKKVVTVDAVLKAVNCRDKAR
jgi:hypothetical protein